MQKNCLNYLTRGYVGAHCIAAICITLLGRLLVSASSPLVVLVLVLVLTPPGQHKLKHDDTVVPRGVLCFCGSARGVYGNESGRGECGLIMEDSSAGAAFILVARMLSM